MSMNCPTCKSDSLECDDCRNSYRKGRVRTAVEILEDYENYSSMMVEFGQRLQKVAADKKRAHELGAMIAEYNGTMQSKTLETWVEIAAQLAELNQHFKERTK